MGGSDGSSGRDPEMEEDTGGEFEESNTNTWEKVGNRKKKKSGSLTTDTESERDRQIKKRKEEHK
ncbi:hypothetical protein M9458_053749, partial [Cirrhinus mrigala]